MILAQVEADHFSQRRTLRFPASLLGNLIRDLNQCGSDGFVQQLILVGEVFVETTVRQASGLHHVTHADGRGPVLFETVWLQPLGCGAGFPLYAWPRIS